MKKLISFALLFLLTKIATATAIVIIVTPQFILLGTDSKRQLLDANAIVRSEQQVCKIQNVGNYCFAIARYTSSQATHFSEEKIITRHLQEATRYTKAIQRIKAELKAKLAAEVKYQQQQRPEAFAQIMHAKEALLEVVVLSMQHGTPQMEIIGFEAGAANNITVGSYTVRCPGDCPRDNQQLFFMGSYEGMEQYLAKGQPQTEPAELVKKLILEQAKATPTSVGAPVNMVKYSANGVEWIK